MTSWKLEALSWNNFQKVKIKQAPKTSIRSPETAAGAGSERILNEQLEARATWHRASPWLTHRPSLSFPTHTVRGLVRLWEVRGLQPRLLPVHVTAAHAGTRPRPMPGIPVPNCEPPENPGSPGPHEARNQTPVPLLLCRASMSPLGSRRGSVVRRQSRKGRESVSGDLLRQRGKHLLVLGDPSEHVTGELGSFSTFYLHRKHNCLVTKGGMEPDVPS